MNIDTNFTTYTQTHPKLSTNLNYKTIKILEENGKKIYMTLGVEMT